MESKQIVLTRDEAMNLLNDLADYAWSLESRIRATPPDDADLAAIYTKRHAEVQDHWRGLLKKVEAAKEK